MSDLLYVNRGSRITRLEREHRESLRQVKENSRLLAERLESLEEYLYLIREDLKVQFIQDQPVFWLFRD